ncbi:exosortase family protein XrtF [Flavobacterium sp. LM5]|uniref:exosortase family protein XrtF n=1 Tax=Flavobacterium sp. LM5 TaxID=1938610 RepID=UPI0026905E99
MKKKSILRNYWTLYKPFLQFIGAFLLTFIGLTLCYQWYLSRFDGDQLDGITRLVASHTKKMLQILVPNSDVVYRENTKISILLYMKEVARIIEGCNAVSVMILFVSFVIAFAGRFKTTFFFLLGGCVLIYVLNVMRIVFLSLLLYRFPAYEHLLHGVIFPLFIYGVVFILWFVWVNYFSTYAKKNTSK